MIPFARTKHMQQTILLILLIMFLVSFLLPACGTEVDQSDPSGTASSAEEPVSAEAADAPLPSPDENNEMTPPDPAGHYTSIEEVALYLHLYGTLPDNFITKGEAFALGWEPREGNLWEVAPGMSIGGDRFGNRERRLPEKAGRQYYECDVNYQGGFRGPERIVYSNDGLVFYTPDHYETFERLYGEEDV